MPGNFTLVVLADAGLAAFCNATGPQITGPGDMIVAATSANGAVVTFNVTATDTTSGVASTDSNPASGSTFPIGDTIVQTTATYKAGNVTRVTKVIKVKPKPKRKPSKKKKPAEPRVARTASWSPQ